MIPEQLFAEHGDVLQAFLARARGIDAARWRTSPAEGKWSPAEVCEHVALTYEALLREAAGGPAMRIRVPWWRRVILRFSVLPAIMKRGEFPERAPAPREIRPPAGSSASREEILARIERAAAEIERHLRVKPRTRLTHPYFGRVGAAGGVRFLSVHTAHHARQLP